MSEWHPTVVDLEVLESEGPSEGKTKLVLHLMTCAACWRASQDFLSGLEDRLAGKCPGKTKSSKIATWARDSALWCLLERFRLEQVDRETTLASAAAVADVRRAQRRTRREAIVKDRGKHHAGFVKGLLSEARSTSSPTEGEEWVGLALVACQQIPPGTIREDHRSDLLAECFAELASARRRSARWIAAREALKQGNENARRGSGNGFVRGLLMAIEGLVEGDCGGLERAEELLSQATRQFIAVGAHGYAARARIQVAYVLLDVAPDRTIEILAEADKMIPESDKRLLMFAESIRIDALITRGLKREAMLRFEALTGLYDQFGDPFVQLRRRFTAARLLEALGRFQEADALFAEVIAADLEQRSNKSYFLDQIYMVGSFTRRGDVSAAVDTCKQAIDALSIMDLDETSDGQMRKLWSSIANKLQRKAITVSVITAARQFIKTQWRTVGGDALLIKESAV
jgi:tetratricopeptide (TPR) repeat protein